MADIFPIFDPVSERLLTYKTRRRVHTEGDWHKGVQANIVRPNQRGGFDILLQLRSSSVDISPKKYDQSLATQMLKRDNLDETNSLRRGLFDELGITNYTALRLPATLRIVKRYTEQPEYLNRELICLFAVTLHGQEPRICTPKIAGLEWVDWVDFQRLFSQEPEKFTKTAQFYFGDARLAPLVEIAARSVLSGTPIPPVALLPDALLHVDCPPESAYTLQGNLPTLYNQQEI